MWKYVVVGVVVFLGIGIALLPARLVDQALQPVQGVDLTEPAGTVWHGSAGLWLDGRQLGRLQWQFMPATLLNLKPGYHYTLLGDGIALQGRVLGNTGSAELLVLGSLDGSAVQPWLAPYNIRVGGELTTDDLQLSGILRDGTLIAVEDASGELHWSGGPVTWELSGNTHSNTLEAMTARLQPTKSGARATVYPQGGQTPLLIAENLPDGFVKIGITRLFTKLLGQPYPGSEPDHAVVLEVEEQLF